MVYRHRAGDDLVKGEMMDYALILQALQNTLEQKQGDYTAAAARSAALSAEYDKAQAKEQQLLKDIETTKASIRGIEALTQKQEVEGHE